MAFIALDCTQCGARLEVDDRTTSYTCKYCHTAHERDYSNGAIPTPHSLRIMAERSIANEEFGKAMQFIEQGLAIDPHHRELLSLEIKAREGLAAMAEGHLRQTTEELKQIAYRGEADQYHLEAQFILNELQANREVYGSNSASTGATPANVGLALQYIDRSLELFPDDPVYLNLKALLLWEGKGNKKGAAKLLERAATLNPRDINIQNNYKALQSSPCFIATAAFGTPFALELNVLRAWRDQHLLVCWWGKRFVAVYNCISPPLRSSSKRVLRSNGQRAG